MTKDRVIYDCGGAPAAQALAAAGGSPEVLARIVGGISVDTARNILANRARVGVTDSELHVPRDLVADSGTTVPRTEPATVPTSMDGFDLRGALQDLGVSQAWFGTWLGSDRHKINRWCRGASPVPRWMGFLLYLLGRERDRLAKGRPDFSLEEALPPPRAGD